MDSPGGLADAERGICLLCASFRGRVVWATREVRKGLQRGPLGSSDPPWLRDISTQLFLSLPQFPHLQSRDGGGACLQVVRFKGVGSQ